MTIDDQAVRELVCCGGKCGRPDDCWSSKERYTPAAKVAAVKAALAEARQEALEECAKLMRELHNATRRPEQRLCYSIAERSIRRGRNLTAAEQLENLAKAFEEEGDTKTAALIRSRVSTSGAN